MRLALCLFALTASAAQPPAVTARLSAIAPRMQALVEAREIPGCVYYVAQHGEVLAHRAVGWQDLESRRPMRTDAIFQIMSMTKPMTAAALMMLVEEGKVVLTDPVERYLPEFAAQPGPQGEHRPVALYQLLTHTSGMQTDPPPEPRKQIEYEMTVPLADAVKFFATLPLRTEPGAHWNYSNMAIATVGRVIEAVSGMPYQKFMQERLLTPLGMNDSFFFPTPARIPRIAMLYRHQHGRLTLPGPDVLGGDPTLYRKGAKYPAPEFGLYSTAADVAAFYQMMLDGGVYRGRRLLSRSSVAVMTALHTGALATFNLGAGNGLAFTVPRDGDATYDLLPTDSFGHGGAFGTWSYADKGKAIVGVFMTQITGEEMTRPQQVFIQMVEAAVDGTK
ncbi:MAG: beta-lactamase family protein [Acidobacteria bacterium]|nr:beta-lactamase family protein [Acidobacteriota bacterium]